MASSRKSKASLKPVKRIAVALSGGLDSVVLLDTVCKSVRAEDAGKADAVTEVWAFHIHHGLQKPADAWLVFCEKLAKKYRIHFDFRLLYLLQEGSANLEAKARAGRYEALEDLCHEHAITDLLLAHHQNDQAETVLLQLLRGAGVAGLSGMPEQRFLGKGANRVRLWRPLLDLSKADLESYAKQHRLKWVEDPSNRNTRYRRNAIRQQVIPRLEKIQPDAVANLARSGALMAESQVLLDRLAAQDGKTIFAQDQLKLKPLLNLMQKDLPAANNLLRYWLRSHQLTMPSQERLQAWWRDLQAVKPDAQLEWLHDQAIIRLWRGQLQVSPPFSNGRWEFKAIGPRSKVLGVDADWVTAAERQDLIAFEERKGGEKFQIKPNTPRKTLKNLFQEGAIAPWLRQAPLLYIDGQLIAVAGLGVSYTHLKGSGRRVLPEWVQNPVK